MTEGRLHQVTEPADEPGARVRSAAAALCLIATGTPCRVAIRPGSDDTEAHHGHAEHADRSGASPGSAVGGVLFLWMIVPLAMTIWFSLLRYNLLTPIPGSLRGISGSPTGLGNYTTS